MPQGLVEDVTKSMRTDPQTYTARKFDQWKVECNINTPHENHAYRHNFQHLSEHPQWSQNASDRI